jgi:hypothetical protein
MERPTGRTIIEPTRSARFSRLGDERRVKHGGWGLHRLEEAVKIPLRLSSQPSGDPPVVGVGFLRLEH